jgi:hypothetical protein
MTTARTSGLDGRISVGTDVSKCAELALEFWTTMGMPAIVSTTKSRSVLEFAFETEELPSPPKNSLLLALKDLGVVKEPREILAPSLICRLKPGPRQTPIGAA